jgi:hypothetical protein
MKRREVVFSPGAEEALSNKFDSITADSNAQTALNYVSRTFWIGIIKWECFEYVK